MTGTRSASSSFPSLIAFGLLTIVLGFAGGGCFAPPERCSDCNGGASGGFGGARGNGGMLGSGGTFGVGGSMSMGGATGARGSSAGGSGAGGAGMGGASMGGSGMGGAGTGGAGMGGAGMGGAGGAIDTSLVAWYQLDDGSGTTAVDSSGHAGNATLMALGGGTAAFSTTHQVGTSALNLASSSATVGGFATLPASLPTMGATTAITIACWVNVRTERAWERVFDFSNGVSTGFIFLTTAQGVTTPNSPRFTISPTDKNGEQNIDMTTPAVLSTNTWHHIAVVLGAGATYTGTLYIDKAVAGRNTAMTLRPSTLGNTPNNWIGRSPFPNDPLFDGLIDDFRIYSRELGAAEIAALP
jgi:Concanavalin A-like lectin/glucanases superfamily